MKKSFPLDPIDVAYDDTGSGLPCLLVHGSGANRNYWKELSNQLSYHRVLRPDLIGHGETPSIHSYSYLHDIELLEKMMEISGTPVDYVGHSAGGAFGLILALKFPEKFRKLVLVEPMVPTILKGNNNKAWQEVSAAYERGHDLAKEGKIDQAAQMLFEYILGDGEWARLSDKIKNWVIASAESTLTSHSKASLTVQVDAKEFEKINIPTLIIHGSETRMPYQAISWELQKRITGSLVKEISGANHNSPLTHADKVNALIKEFL